MTRMIMLIHFGKTKQKLTDDSVYSYIVISSADFIDIRLLSEMRITFCCIILAVAIVLNLVILYYVSQVQQRMMQKHKEPVKTGLLQPSSTTIAGITVLVREFEDFENYIPDVIQSFLKQKTEQPILIFADKLPYPPLTLPSRTNVQIVLLKTLLDQPARIFKPEFHVRTEYILLVPDGIQLDNPKQLERLLQELDSQNGRVRMVAAPVLSAASVRCLDLKVNIKEWTIIYSVASSFDECSALTGNVVILLKTKDFFDLPLPLARPLITSIFIQTSVRGWTVRILDDVTFLPSHQPLFTSSHNQWKADNLVKERTVQLFRQFDIKRVIDVDGKEQWYGCRKETSRCFGTVHDDTPDYLYQNRWTPPCCLRALRETTKYVISILESSGVRYWLEGGTLLGAARHKDLIPWDYDVDLGIYLEDIPNCDVLQSLDSGSIVDENGYVWEKAIEGDFYRVQYSESNHLHVDLWPFYSKNGVMTKDTWTGHKQDIEFPEHFLKPLVPMQFAGITAYAPNNHRAFLELKFGAGVIENPQYPNPQKKKLE
ncbi:fukutin-related protein [Protopterus annectens]|uniref:fukutin-related protein n=1 Tax=Protopterus annectens TaxID=7888 RepID=UPI001CF9AD06|nr:fukutin-related protein [Protopterus annectens]XP_043936720.1 fukutin-related protein [Protopterus annectens]